MSGAMIKEEGEIVDYSLINDIPMHTNWSKVEPLYKGWSDDKKFYIEDNTGQKLLLRVSDYSKYEVKRLENEYMNKASSLGITMSKPLDFGVCSNGKSVYLLLTWVEGEDAETALPRISEREQYNLGLKAGQILQKIHTIPAAGNQEGWADRYKRKIEQKIRAYRDCSVKLDNDAEFIRFLEKNISCLNYRPQVYQHGDFHIGNLIVTKDNDIGVIDFNRSDFGDPWEEFNRCVFSCKVSVPFVLGQIHGYFDQRVPDKFFRLMALYIITNIISSIPWAIPFGEEDVKYMINNANEVYSYFNGLKTYVPIWYKESFM